MGRVVCVVRRCHRHMLLIILHTKRKKPPTASRSDVIVAGYAAKLIIAAWPCRVNFITVLLNRIIVFDKMSQSYLKSGNPFGRLEASHSCHLHVQLFSERIYILREIQICFFVNAGQSERTQHSQN